MNTKVVVGSKHGPTYYPNTALFPPGGRISSISMSVDEVIDRIDWNITDANKNTQYFRMGYEVKEISQEYQPQEGDIIKAVRIWYYLEGDQTYSFPGM